MYPHERSLVKKLADKPFAILGINSDHDRKELKDVMKNEKEKLMLQRVEEEVLEYR